MGFSWNGIHTNTVGIRAELVRKPILPEPRLFLEEVPGRDGFYDFSSCWPDGKPRYKPVDWEFRCGFEGNIAGAASAVLALFSSYKGELIADDFPGVVWDGVLTNKLDISTVAGVYREFPIYIRTQPFGAAIETGAGENG
jgi:hypothetical protein